MDRVVIGKVHRVWNHQERRRKFVVVGDDVECFEEGQQVYVLKPDTLDEIAGIPMVLCEACGEALPMEEARGCDEGGYLCAPCVDEIREAESVETDEETGEAG